MHHHHPLLPAQPVAVVASTSAAAATASNVSNSSTATTTATVSGNTPGTSAIPVAGPSSSAGGGGGGGSGTTHAQQRRRKKRPNYGTRTVEVRRGYNGFGFTISGQQPCRLSCIVANSPADQAGLRAGDFLISVNGLNVSKLPHETVVQLIGNSFGSIRMQIAENYYSDSSDEENAALMLQQQMSAVTGIGGMLSNQLGFSVGGARAKPRYLHHKTKMHRLRNSPQKKRTITLQQQQQMQRAEQLSKCVSALKPMELQTLRPLIEDLPLPVGGKSVTNLQNGVASKISTSNSNTATVDVVNVSAIVRAPSAALEYRAIVGYLGTIEMPKQISHSSKLQTVRSCIRKLRQEKRQPTIVLMIILPDCLRLQAANGNMLASYASERLNYVSSSSESENRFFGLVTSAVHTSQLDEDDDDLDQEELDARNALPVAAAINNNARADHISISHSCHVFVVDTKLCEHQAHVPRAAEFRIHCTRDPISNLCLEFPNNSEYVVNLIRSMYTMRIAPPAIRHHVGDEYANGNAGGVAGQAAVAHSPQPSNHSEISTTTSNSDSGIGFHNDCNNISDRILVVDFPGAPELRMRPLAARPVGIFNNFEPVIDKRPTARAALDPKAPSVLAGTSQQGSTRSNLMANFNLIKSPATCLSTTRSCDDVLALVERVPDDIESGGDQSTLIPHASMDDISLHSTTIGTVSGDSEKHIFLHPANCSLFTSQQKPRGSSSSQVYALLQQCLSNVRFAAVDSSTHQVTTGIKEKPRPQTQTRNTTTGESKVTKRHSLGFQALDTCATTGTLDGNHDLDTWRSLQDLHAANEHEHETMYLHMRRSLDGIVSEPDLLNPNLPANASPFRRAWAQSSFRTPRTDKHAHQHQQQQQQHHHHHHHHPHLAQHPHLSPLVRRAASMTASDNDVYIKSIQHSYIDELKQTRSQYQITNAAAIKSAATALQASAANNTNGIGGSGPVTQLALQPKSTAASADNDVTGVAAWGASFERLLEDPAGLHTFAEFLKKEFSAENIYFWTACERFRHMEHNADRVSQAMAIFSKHLANGALEPVNVDSQARNLTQEKLQSAQSDLFAYAQKQIFNLMKFDSYQRFIRSELYKSCMEAEEKRQPLPYGADDLDELLKTHAHQVAHSNAAGKLKKSASNAEERCRKSLLPWHRKTSSNKARECTSVDNEQKSSKLPHLSSQSLKLPSTQNSLSDIHSSRSSLSSFDGLPGASIVPGTCRVILSDASTTMVQTRASETVAQLVERLMEKRGFHYQYYDVVAKGTTKSIDLQSPSQTLIGKDVLIEQRVAFKLDLPDRKVISVKSKQKKQLHEVIRPILHKYNYDIDAVQVVLRETQACIDLALPVTVADGQRLQAVWLKPPPLLNSDYQNGGGGCGGTAAKGIKTAIPKSVSFPTTVKQPQSVSMVANVRQGNGMTVGSATQTALDEITNKVFTELMQGKVEAANAEKQQLHKTNDLCSLKSDDCASETSSIFDRMRRRDSNLTGLKLKLKKKSTSSQQSEETNQSNQSNSNNNQNLTTATQSTNTTSTTIDIKKPIIAKLKAGVKLQMPERVAENQDELLEGLKRAQLARLEDQRGTEINFELPEFLKNKENFSASKLRKARANLSPINKPYSITTEELPSPQSERPQPAPRHSIANKLKAAAAAAAVNATLSSSSKAEDELIPTVYDTRSQTQVQAQLSIQVTTPSQANTSNSSVDPAEYTLTTSCKGPPPLPPKPKVLPIKPSNWGVSATSRTNSPTSPTMPPTITTTATSKYYTSVTNVASATIPDDGPTLHNSKLCSDISGRKSLLAATETVPRCAYLEEPSSSFV